MKNVEKKVSPNSIYGEWFNGNLEVLKKHFQPAQLLDKRIVDVFECVRGLIGGTPLYISSGFRTVEHNQKIGGSKFSQHTYGRAFDASSKIAAQTIRQKIFDELGIEYSYESIKGAAELEPITTGTPLDYIKGIEVGITWLHLDVRWSDKIIVFSP